MGVIVVRDVAHRVVDEVREAAQGGNDLLEAAEHVCPHGLRRGWVMHTPDDHRDRAELTLGHPAHVVFEEPCSDARRLAEVTVRSVRHGVGQNVIAARTSATYSPTASGPWSMRRLTTLAPWMTPSATRHASRA